MKSITKLRAANGVRLASDNKLAAEVRVFLEKLLETFPWRVRVQDWTEATYDLGGDSPHWSGHESLDLRVTPQAGHDLLALDIMRFLERFLDIAKIPPANLIGVLTVLNMPPMSFPPLMNIPRASRWGQLSRSEVSCTMPME